MPGDPSDYERLGGHDGVVALVERFYANMDRLPEAATIRALHDDDLTSDKHKLAAFLSGFLGGPPLYWHDHGEPELRRRHAHLPVDTEAARAWLRCMTLALEQSTDDAALRRNLLRRFSAAAGHIRNR